MSLPHVPRLRRRPSIRYAKSRFTIYCEGSKTEPAYFGAIKKAYSGAIVSIEIHGGTGVPYTIAETAVKDQKTRKRRNSFEEHDQIWVVFDRDEHPRHSEAVALCNRFDVKVARSNPCFEVWLILHETDYDKPDHRQAVQAHFALLKPEYKVYRHKWLDCTDLVSHVQVAERRAELQLKRRADEGSPYGPPSTTACALTKAIREASERALDG